MAKNIFIGVNNVAKKPKNIYVGVNGVARKVKAAYVGVNGVARKVWPSSLIPTEYQAVEYIQNASGFDEQGYFNTGVKPDNYTRIVGKFSNHGPMSSFSGKGNYLCYLKEFTDSSNYYHFGFSSKAWTTSSGEILLEPTLYFGPTNNSQYGGYLYNPWARKGAAYDDAYIYDLNNNKQAIFDNVPYQAQIQNTVTFNQSNSKILIFATNTVSTSNVSTVDYRIGINRLYYFKIYSNYTTLIRDFYPCYRKSDRTPGLFDAVTGVFYTNAISGGIFPVGSDITIEG